VHNGDAIKHYTFRANFNGGSSLSDPRPLLPHGVDRQTGLTRRIAAPLIDTRHSYYITRF
jgi:hypothetical protein